MPRADAAARVVPTVPCCGRYPVMERIGNTAFQVACAFCHRQSPIRAKQNDARRAWNELQPAAPEPPASAATLELRNLMAERLARYQRGELAWQQSSTTDPPRHPITARGLHGRARPRRVA